MKANVACVLTVLHAVHASIPYGGSPKTLPGSVLAGQFDWGEQGDAYYDSLSSASGPKARAETPVNVNEQSAVCHVADGEWLAYTVNVPQGEYNVVYEVAGDPPHGGLPLSIFATLRDSCSGDELSAHVLENWFSTEGFAKELPAVAPMTFPGGDVTLRICFEKAAYVEFHGFTVKDASIDPRTDPSSGAETEPTNALEVVKSTPFEWKRQNIPGTILAQRFDNGGNGVAYKETSASSAPKVRAGAAVTGQGSYIGYINPGEWVKYSVQVATSGSYNVAYMLAGAPPKPVPQSMNLVINGECSTGPAVAVFSKADFNTYNWSPAQPFGTSTVYLSAGAHVITVCFKANTWTNFYGVRFSATTSANSATGTPYNGQRQAVPGLVKAHLFDSGPAGVAYLDKSTSGTYVRSGAKVGGSGTTVGYVQSGEWIRYSIDVKAAGNYGVNYVLAGKPPSSVPLQVHLVLDSNDCSKASKLAYVSISFNPGDWSKAVNYGGKDVYLPAGAHSVTICFVQASYLNFIGLQFGTAGSGTYSPVPPTGGAAAVIGGTNPFASTNNGGYTATPAFYKNFPLSWSDEFNGNVLDTGKWQHSIGHFHGNGNNEKQYYARDNVAVNGGNLVIEARKQRAPDGSNYQYTSGKIMSKGKSGFNQKYGRIETRAMFDNGQGLWPAFWMLPQSFNAASPYGHWPQSGEIDIFEGTNSLGVAHQTLHYGSSAKHQFKGCNYFKNGGFASATGFHNYAVEWAPWGEFKFYVDGSLACSQNQWWSGGGAYPAPFNQEFYVILNLAVGGNWPGWVDEKIFANGRTRRAWFDYVRVYDWPKSRRLSESPDGESSFEHVEAEGWEVPEGFNRDTNEWLDGYGPKARHLSANEDNDDTKDECRPMPYLEEQGERVPWELPVTYDAPELIIGAEYFDIGGEGCSYHDSDFKNTGNNALRMLDGVDLFEYENGRNGVYVGHMAAGEWLSYTVSGEVQSTYWLEVYATNPSGGRAAFSTVLDSFNCEDPTQDGGSTLTAATNVVPAAGATAWRYYGQIVSIPAGAHTLTLCAVAGSLNVDFIKFKPANAAPLGEKTYSIRYSGVMPQEKCKLVGHCGASLGPAVGSSTATAQAVAESRIAS